MVALAQSHPEVFGRLTVAGATPGAAIDRIVFRQGKAPTKPRQPPRPPVGPVPKELGDGLREIADPELRACLESLAARIGATSGPPSLPDDGDVAIPLIRRSR